MPALPLDVAALARALREARIASGLRQVEVASRMGISQQQLARMESGRARDVTMGLLARWSAGVGRRTQVVVPGPRSPARGRSAASRRLPRSLYPLFWDCDPRTVDAGRHRRYIVDRILEEGDLGAIAWLRSALPRGSIVREARRSRALSPRARAFARFL